MSPEFTPSVELQQSITIEDNFSLSLGRFDAKTPASTNGSAPKIDVRKATKTFPVQTTKQEDLKRKSFEMLPIKLQVASGKIQTSEAEIVVQVRGAGSAVDTQTHSATIIDLSKNPDLIAAAQQISTYGLPPRKPGSFAFIKDTGEWVIQTRDNQWRPTKADHIASVVKASTLNGDNKPFSQRQIW